MHGSLDEKKNRIKAALGQRKADLVIKNGMVVNVFSGEIAKADVAVSGGVIVGIGDYSGAEEIDAAGKYVCPGLIDSHVHIESSMLTPAEFCKAVLVHGTTTVIADPHEIANVCGMDGIAFMLEQARETPANVFFMAPSCVPSMNLQNSGGTISADDMRELLKSDRILGLGEVMDFGLVLRGDDAILEKMALFETSVIDGHSPGISAKELTAYRVAGAMTDHECTTAAEAIERIRLGMYVQIREGSAARNLTDIVTGLREAGMGFDRCVFCTDDKHLEDIRKDGHVIENVRKAIALGVEPIEAIRMATLNSAQCYRLQNIGAIAPGYFADLVILNDLTELEIDSVLVRGVPVDGAVKAHGREILSAAARHRNVLDSVHIGGICAQDLTIRLSGPQAVVIQVIPGQILTKKATAQVKQKDGEFLCDSRYAKMAVIERHRGTGRIGLGIVEGFGITNGAIATTVGHDAHNLAVIGDNDRDMLLAVEEIVRRRGGFAVVRSGEAAAALSLPIAGLMSGRNARSVESDFKRVYDAAMELCANKAIDPFMTLAFLPLPVIPQVRLMDLGLFDTGTFEVIGIDGEGRGRPEEKSSF